jgi:spore coat protein CotF
MYQQNFTNQQGFNQQASNQQGQQGQGNPMQEQDWGNLLLSELKRSAGEYTTAALEATHPALCQTFQSLSQKTIQDQSRLFNVLSQLNGYGSIQLAHPQEIQQELQQQSQKAEQLQLTVQQCLQAAYTAGAGIYQQQAAQQNYYPENQPFQQIQANAYGGYGQSSSGVSSGSSAGQADSQGSQRYGQGYPSGYTNTSSNQSFNQSPSTGSSYGQQTGNSSNASQTYGQQSNTKSSFSPSSSALSDNNAKLASPDSSEHPRGGNSFNWTASEESESPSSGTAAQLSQSRDIDSSSKYIL